MTTRARSRNSTSGCKSACVPTTAGVRPEARLASIEARARPFSRPVRKPISTRAARGVALQCRVVLAGEDLGRRHQCRLAAALDRGQHREQRDDRLAAADIALQQPHHAPRLRHVARRSRRSRGAARRSAQSRAPPRPAPVKTPGADDRPPLLPTAPGADQRHRELAGEDLVIGEPLARRGRRRRDRPRSAGHAPGGPPRPRRANRAARASAGSIHSGNAGSAVERRPDRLLHDARRQAGGQRIDRLDRLEAVEPRPAATRGRGAPSAACRRRTRPGR